MDCWSRTEQVKEHLRFAVIGPAIWQRNRHQKPALLVQGLEIASLSASGLVQVALQGADRVLIAALINGFVFNRSGKMRLDL